MAQIAPLFCTAYIDNKLVPQQGQEATVAKYPLIVFGSRTQAADIAFKNTVKAINPRIKILAYVLGNERTQQSNPGLPFWNAVPVDDDHECNYLVNGVKFYPSIGGKHLFDFRTAEYRTAFSAACDATLASWPYDGLYIDNCTVFDAANPDAGIRQDMRDALQVCISDVRAAHPGIIFIGNSQENWVDLNGELNEGRFSDWDELTPVAGQASPNINIAQCYVTSPELGTLTEAQIETQMLDAHALGAFYAISPSRNDYQHALWYDFFDDVIAAYPPDPPEVPLPIRIRMI
jgi:hypothetical protein